MIVGLEDVAEGTILIGGDDVTDKAPRDRNLAMVFENGALSPHLRCARTWSSRSTRPARGALRPADRFARFAPGRRQTAQAAGCRVRVATPETG